MTESRVEKVAVNAMTSFAASIVSAVCRFLLQMLFVRTLGKYYLGINGLFTNVLSLLSLADLGMNTAMLYSLYKPVAEGNAEKIAALIWYFRKLYWVVVAVILVAGLACIPFLDYIVKTDQAIEHLELYYALFLLKTVVSYLFVYRTTLLIADQKQYILKKYEMIFELVKFICQASVLIFLQDYVMYLVIDMLTVILVNCVGNRKVCEIYPYTKKQREEKENTCISDDEKKEIKINLKALLIYRIAGTIEGNTDAILISVYVGTVEVGYYSNYLLVINAIITILSLVYASIKASLGNFIVTYTSAEDRNGVFEVLEKVCFWLISFCSVCFWVLMQDFIEVAYGHNYLLEKQILFLMIANFYTSNIRQNIWAYRETMGFFHRTRYITVVTASLNLILSLIGGHVWGISGIIGASIISRLAYAGWKEPLILYHEGFNKSAKIYFIKYIKNVLLTCVIAALTSGIVSNITIDNVYVRFICKCSVCLIIPNIFFVFYVMPSKEGKYLFETLKQICGKRLRK